ncbi:hypothetical protein N7I30_01415 [Aurantimonas litoralis]|nr:hypothetical protein [Aurantimonas litoralis]
MSAATNRSTLKRRDMAGAIVRMAGRARIERVLDRSALSAGSAATSGLLQDSRDI